MRLGICSDPTSLEGLTATQSCQWGSFMLHINAYTKYLIGEYVKTNNWATKKCKYNFMKILCL